MAKISEILDQNSNIYDLVLQDIGTAGSETGARGEVDPIVKTVLKQIRLLRALFYGCKVKKDGSSTFHVDFRISCTGEAKR